MTRLHFLSIRGKTLDIIDAILHTGEVTSVGEAMLGKIHLLVEEAVANIVDYAYPEGAEAYLDVEIENSDGHLTLRFHDGGIPFNPLTKGAPDTSLPMDHRPIGGLGIYLIRKNADAVDYEYANGENILSVMKRIR